MLGGRQDASHRASQLTQEVFTRPGDRLVLSGIGSSGGEGTVYEISGRPELAAKIYHASRASEDALGKLEAMLDAPPVDPTLDTRRHRSIAWPQKLLYLDSSCRQLAGFTMPRVDRSSFREAHTYYDPADRIRRFGGAYTWRHLFIAAHNLASAVAAVHDQGHRIGDLRETNVLLAPNSLITLIDCDSFEIHDATGTVFYSNVGSGDYLPPELQSVRLGDGVDRYHADLFALGVLLFRFLMLGAHPFQARGPGVEDAPSIEAKIARATFPYRGNRAIKPPEFAPPFEALQPGLRRLFIRTFVDGHADPLKRPAAKEWFEAISAEGPKLKQCRGNPHHWFGGHQFRCPWCAMSGRSGRDPFPRDVSLGSQLTAGDAAPVNSSNRRDHLRVLASMALADGDLSAQEQERLSAAASELGIRPIELRALIAEERHKAKHQWVKDEPNAEVEEVSHSSRVGLRGAGGLAPFALLMAAAAIVVPLATSMASILLIAPALATGSQLRRRRDYLRAIPLMAQNMALALYHLIPAAVWAAPVVAGLFIAVRFGVLDSRLGLQLAAAAGNAWWWGYLLWLTREREHYPFVAEVRALLLKTASKIWAGPRTYLTWATLPVVASAALVLLALAGKVTYWPFG